MHHPSVTVAKAVANSAWVLLVIICTRSGDWTAVIPQVQGDVVCLVVNAWQSGLDLPHLQQLLLTLLSDRKLAALPLGKAIVFEWLNDLLLEP